MSIFVGIALVILRFGEVSKPMRGRPSTIAGPRRYPNRLGELRRRSGLSQQGVAAAAAISAAYYGALERGDKRINSDTAERLSGPLRCAVGDLLAGTQGVSVPLSVVVAAAESTARPEIFDLPEPQERLRPPRLADTEGCFAAELFDDSADLDFAPGAILVVRELRQLRAVLKAGDKVLVRFFLDPAELVEPRRTHEILYGILDRTIVGDLVLITRTRNRLIPRHALIQAAAAQRAGLADGVLDLPSRAATIEYEPRADDPATILGVVVYVMATV
jgi:transcriptional regulator with XRE-family HTH domain